MDEPWVPVQDALKQWARTCLWAQSPQELIEGFDQVQVLTCQLAALNLQYLQEINNRGIPTTHGATSTTAWLRDRYRLSPGTANQHVTLATTLNHQLPETTAALAEGTINPEQAQLIAKIIPDLPAQYRTDGEKLLLEQCATLGPRELGFAAERLLEYVAPEVAEQQAATQLERAERRAHTDQCLHLTDVHDAAQVRVSGWLDRASAAFIRAALDPLCAPRPTPNSADPRTPAPTPRSRCANSPPTAATYPTTAATDLCGHHHRLIHQGHWQIKIATNGLPEFTPPAYIDPEQQPQRNVYHRRE